MTLFEEPVAAPAPVLLRPYQEKCVAAVHAAKDRGLGRVLVVMPTGCGKTTVFAKLIGDLPQDAGSLVVAHRSELLAQARDRIAHQNPHLRVGIEGGTDKAGAWCQSVVAGVQTIGREGTTRLNWLLPALLVIDEAHHAPAESYQHVMRRVGSYEGRCFTVGVTATPHRMDNRPLHGDHERAIFEEVVFQYTLKDAIGASYLCDLKGYRVGTSVDLSQIKTTAGDYNQGELQRAVNVTARNQSALKHWQEVASNRQTIAFCAGVDHARDVAAVFREAGVKAEHVDGSMSAEERDAVIKRYRSGATRVLTNVDICTEGFDVPNTECVLMMRPTQSWAMFTQMVGRGLRLSEGKKDCIVIDVVDNAAKLSVASVPALLGLPPKLDLKGKSLKEAAQLFDDLDEVQRGALFHRPNLTVDSLCSKLTAVDLLCDLSLPDDIAGVAELAWLKVGDDKYYLDLQRFGDAHLECDALGNWCARIKVTQSGHEHMKMLGTDRKAAFVATENAVRQISPEASRFGIEAKWRTDSPTDKQVELLRKLKVEEEIIKELSRGQASTLITARLQSRRMR